MYARSTFATAPSRPPPSRRSRSKRALPEPALLAQVVVAKTADHLPLHRQEKIFQRFGVDISRKTMCGWLAQCADLLQPLFGKAKEVLFESKVIGTDDTGVEVLDGKLPFARIGRIWPYYGDRDHPVILYDYTRRGRGPDRKNS
jgi:transposase